MLPPSSNWYCGGVAACTPHGLLAYGANNAITLVDIVQRYGVTSGAAFDVASVIRCVCVCARARALPSIASLSAHCRRHQSRVACVCFEDDRVLLSASDAGRDYRVECRLAKRCVQTTRSTAATTTTNKQQQQQRQQRQQQQQKKRGQKFIALERSALAIAPRARSVFIGRVRERRDDVRARRRADDAATDAAARRWRRGRHQRQRIGTGVLRCTGSRRAARRRPRRAARCSSCGCASATLPPPPPPPTMTAHRSTYSRASHGSTLRRCRRCAGTAPSATRRAARALRARTSPLCCCRRPPDCVAIVSAISLGAECIVRRVAQLTHKRAHRGARRVVRRARGSRTSRGRSLSGECCRAYDRSH